MRNTLVADCRYLKRFVNRLKDTYETGRISTPIHLSGGNERKLIDIFKKIHPDDWIFSTYRSHYHWLLSGRNARDLENKIYSGQSMHIYDRKFFTSAIVAGSAPIALGVALALRLRKKTGKVWCFIGDMAATSGLFSECVRFAQGHDLPVTYVIEDNAMSVNTCTRTVWGKGKKKKVMRYAYKRIFPHAGTGKYVLF